MAPVYGFKSQPLRKNKSITEFFPRKNSAASSSPAPSAAPSPRPPTASGSRVASSQGAQGSKAATRVVKRAQDSSPIPLTAPTFVPLRLNKLADEIIEISDKSHISISSTSPSPKPVKRSLFPRNGVVHDLTTPEPPPRRSRFNGPPIVISSSSESRTTNGSYKRSLLSDTDTEIQVIAPPLKRQRTASVRPVVQRAPTLRPLPPAPPPTSSSPKQYSPVVKITRQPSLVQPLSPTSSDESSVPYSPFVQRPQSAKARNARVPLSSSNIIQRPSASPTKRQPARSPSGPLSQNASPAQFKPRPTSTPFRKRPSKRPVAESEASDFAMDLSLPVDDFAPMDDFVPMDVGNEQPQAPTPKAPSPIARLPSGTLRTPEQAYRSNTPKNSQPRPSGLSATRRVTPQSAKRPSPAQRPATAADLLKSIEAAIDSGSSSESELDYEQLMAETAIHASESDESPRAARRRVNTLVVSTASEAESGTIDDDRDSEDDESPRAARRRTRVVLDSNNEESDPAAAGHASTEEVSDSEPEGSMPRFAAPQRALVASSSCPGIPTQRSLPPLSAFSSLTTLTSASAGSPPHVNKPNFPSSAFDSPLTELGSPSTRNASARTTNTQTTPVQARLRARPCTAKSPTGGTPHKVMEVVVPSVKDVARAGLRRYTAADKKQTTLDCFGAARGTRTGGAKKRAPVPEKSVLPPRVDGGSVIEQLLKDKRRKDENAEVEAAAAAINEQHRLEAQRIRDATRREERQLNGEPASSPKPIESDEEMLDMRAMQLDSKLLLDSEGQRTFATLVEAVGEDEERGWCARIGYSPFWETVTTAEAEAVAPSYPSFTDAEACPNLAKAARDPNMLVVFLAVGILPTNEPVVSWLFETAMLPDTSLSFAAFDRLQSLLRKRDGEFQLSTSVLLKPLIRFGATREVMDAIDPALYEKFEGPSNRPDEKRRDEAMRYWLTLVAELARTGRLLREETPKLALTIILLALDAHSSQPLFTLAMTTLEHVCAQVLRGTEDVPLELDICRTIWLWAEGAELPVKARILDIIRGGRCLAHLGRWIAHAFLTGLDLRNMDTETFAGLPPLDVLIPLLSQTRPPRDGSQTPDVPAPFVISSETDYIAMGHYADLLARTLTNMRDYYASSALAAPAVCDLQQIEIVTTRLAGQIPGGIKAGSLAAASVQQNLESTRLRLAAELQVFKPRQRNVLEYLSSPKKDGSDDGSASE